MLKPSFLLLILLSFSLASCKTVVEEEDLEFGDDQALTDGDNDENKQDVFDTYSNEDFTTDEDTALNINPVEINQQWDSRKIYDPSNGIATFDGEILKYEPLLDYSGDDFIKVEYSLAGSVVFARNITLKVNSVNDAPVANDDSASTTAAVSIQIDVLANDVDVDLEDEITLKSVSAASNGTASIVDGKISYHSDDAYNGSETLTYTIEDKAGASAQGTLSITVSYDNNNGGGGSTVPEVPVRLVFIEHSDGSKLTSDYAAYAANVVEKLNETYTNGEDQQLNFVLDSHTSLVNDDYYVVPSSGIVTALSYFQSNHNTSGKVNIYFVSQIVGGVAGVAFVNQTTTTTSMFEKMATAALEKNVVGHEIGHNVGFLHTADQNISEDRYIGYQYSSCNLDTFYFQKSGVTYPPGDANWDGWHYGANLMYPIASPNPSSLFTGKYDVVFSELMACWHQRSNW